MRKYLLIAAGVAVTAGLAVWILSSDSSPSAPSLRSDGPGTTDADTQAPAPDHSSAPTLKTDSPIELTPEDRPAITPRTKEKRRKFITQYRDFERAEQLTEAQRLAVRRILADAQTNVLLAWNDIMDSHSEIRDKRKRAEFLAKALGAPSDLVNDEPEWGDHDFGKVVHDVNREVAAQLAGILSEPQLRAFNTQFPSFALAALTEPFDVPVTVGPPRAQR